MSITIKTDNQKHGNFKVYKAVLWDNLNNSEVGYFEISGPEFDTGETMSMGISIDDNYIGKGYARELIKHNCANIRKNYPQIRSDQLLLIDADASEGFWDKIGMKVNRYGIDSNTTRNLEGRGYEKSITFNELCKFGGGKRKKSRQYRKTKRNVKKNKKTLKRGGGIENIMPELIEPSSNIYQISNTEFYSLMKEKGLLYFPTLKIELSQLQGWLYTEISPLNRDKVYKFFATITDKLRTNDILIISDNKDNYGLIFQIKEEKLENNDITVEFNFIHSYSVPIDEQKQFLKFKESKQSFPYSFKTLQKHIEKELNLRMKNAQIYQIESIPLYHLLKDQKQLNEIKTYDKPINIKEFELQQLYDDVLDNTAMDKSIMSETDQNVLSNFFTTNEEKFKENDILIINKSLYYIIKIDDKNNISFILIIEKSNKVEQRKKMVELTKKLRENRKKYNIKTPGFTSLWDEEEKPMMKRSKTSQNLKKLT